MSTVGTLRLVPEKVDARRVRSKVTEYALLLLVAVLVAVGARMFLVQTFYIPSESMERTLLRDDKVLVDKVTYRFRDPRRGEILVFRPPPGWGEGASRQDYIKRVIGVGGDRVVCCDPQRRITVNGQPVDEDYLYPGDTPSETEFDVTVPRGRLLLLGDHRSGSADSRAHADADNGTVPVERVVGRAFAIYWPGARWRVLSVPDAFDAVSAGGPGAFGTRPTGS